MNENTIITNDFSNPESRRKYMDGWPDEPHVQAHYENGMQCGGCAFFAPLNDDYGICCHPESRHLHETVFEHFTCPTHVEESWRYHSFLDDTDDADLLWEKDQMLFMPETVFQTAVYLSETDERTPHDMIRDGLREIFPSLPMDHEASLALLKRYHRRHRTPALRRPPHVLTAEQVTEISALEQSLWQADSRFDMNYMEQILHSEFFEFGCSGKRYTRAETLAVPRQEIEATLKDMGMVALSSTAVLVTYVSEVDADELRVCNRSSVWLYRGGHWQLRFHQGTRVP